LVAVEIAVHSDIEVLILGAGLPGGIGPRTPTTESRGSRLLDAGHWAPVLNPDPDGEVISIYIEGDLHILGV
jgi:hypothetical protein